MANIKIKSTNKRLTPAELAVRGRQAEKILTSCSLCPRECRVNRLAGEKGFCGGGAEPRINSFHAHFGEEACLVGEHGSGTIFFSSCHLACRFCQNADISQHRLGQDISIKELAGMMLKLQDKKAHNINLVSPTIWAAPIIQAVALARKKGLALPLVYNTGGYERVETLKLFDGVVDIYLPDLKYSDSAIGQELSLVGGYFETAAAAIREMHRQVGDLEIDKSGLAVRGLLVRHLVLPHGLAGTKKALAFLRSLSPRTAVNIMDQYNPAHEALFLPGLNRRITAEEFEAAISEFNKTSLKRVI